MKDEIGFWLDNLVKDLPASKELGKHIVVGCDEIIDEIKSLQPDAYLVKLLLETFNDGVFQIEKWFSVDPIAHTQSHAFTTHASQYWNISDLDQDSNLFQVLREATMVEFMSGEEHTYAWFILNTETNQWYPLHDRAWTCWVLDAWQDHDHQIFTTLNIPHYRKFSRDIDTDKFLI